MLYSLFFLNCFLFFLKIANCSYWKSQEQSVYQRGKLFTFFTPSNFDNDARKRNWRLVWSSYKCSLWGAELGGRVTPVWMRRVWGACRRRAMPLTPSHWQSYEWETNGIITFLNVELGMCWLDYEGSNLTKGTKFGEGVCVESEKPRGFYIVRYWLKQISKITLLPHLVLCVCSVFNKPLVMIQSTA